MFFVAQDLQILPHVTTCARIKPVVGYPVSTPGWCSNPFANRCAAACAGEVATRSFARSASPTRARISVTRLQAPSPQAVGIPGARGSRRQSACVNTLRLKHHANLSPQTRRICAASHHHQCPASIEIIAVREFGRVWSCRCHWDRAGQQFRWLQSERDSVQCRASSAMHQILTEITGALACTNSGRVRRVQTLSRPRKLRDQPVYDIRLNIAGRKGQDELNVLARVDARAATLSRGRRIPFPPATVLRRRPERVSDLNRQDHGGCQQQSPYHYMCHGGHDHGEVQVTASRRGYASVVNRRCCDDQRQHHDCRATHCLDLRIDSQARIAVQASTNETTTACTTCGHQLNPW
jgi:hypothetical protein